MKPRLLFPRTRCVAPVTTEPGVLACVRTAAAGTGTCSDHTAWRSFVWPLRILWTLKRWWPNELGRAMDRAGRGYPLDRTNKYGDALDLVDALTVLASKGLDIATPGGFGDQVKQSGDITIARELAALSREQIAKYEDLFARRERMAATVAAQALRPWKAGGKTGTTDDPTDPRLTRGADTEPVPQAPVYLVLSDSERSLGFVRPVRRAYIHTVCGGVTTMSQTIAETYARDPHFYGATYCVHCAMHRPVGEDGEFIWGNADQYRPDQRKVGT